MGLTGQLLLDYACEQFEKKQYDAALDAFILAYTKDYEQEWILENIYNCYMAGNETEFSMAYEAWRNHVEGGPLYEECLLDFIPCHEREYYIFDKERKCFCGVFSADKLKKNQRLEGVQKVEFSGIAAVVDWNSTFWMELLKEAEFRKVYFVCTDVRRCASFFKIPELKDYAENIMIFSGMNAFRHYFHFHTSEYLPKMYVGTEEEKKQFMEILHQEHEYRLTPAGRNVDNVLLTIAIPTYGRGNLLLKRLKNLLQMEYDAEIEFSVSKNGKIFYQEEYEQASKLADARINYVGTDEEFLPSQNWQKAVQISHGKYVMLVSDEDDVIISALEHYLHLINSHEQLAIVRPNTMYQYGITSNEYYECGVQALLGGLFANNYISGMIFNREMFLNADIPYWEKNYSENEFYRMYPHAWWQILLAFEGDYALDIVSCIQEGESMQQEEKAKYQKINDSRGKSRYADDAELSIASTYDSRIKQFRGGAALIRNFDKLSEEIKVEVLNCLIGKTLYLMELVYSEYSYKRNEFPMWMEKFMDEVLAVIQEWELENDVQVQILRRMQGYINQINSIDYGNATKTVH